MSDLTTFSLLHCWEQLFQVYICLLPLFMFVLCDGVHLVTFINVGVLFAIIYVPRHELALQKLWADGLNTQKKLFFSPHSTWCYILSNLHFILPLLAHAVKGTQTSSKIPKTKSGDIVRCFRAIKTAYWVALVTATIPYSCTLSKLFREILFVWPHAATFVICLALVLVHLWQYVIYLQLFTRYIVQLNCMIGL